MASRLETIQSPDDIDQLLYLKNAQGLYRGFKAVYISQKLSKREGYLVTCTRCKGIIRDASSCGGETVCQLCARNQLNTKRVQKVRNSVANLNIKCPLLRDCGWSGKLLEGEKHLEECGSFLITCPLRCGDVMKRCEMNNHIKIDSLHRVFTCEFCDLAIHFKNLTGHLRRDEVEKHIDRDCELIEIECPYAKYSCKIGKILRKDLLAHKKEFYIEHQDMIERENCLLTKQVESLISHNSKIMQRHDLLEEKMKEENYQLMQKHELIKKTTQTKNDQLVTKHNLLEKKMKAEVDQLVLDYVSMATMSQTLLREIGIRKKLIGTTIGLNLRSNAVALPEFGNGQYRFVCEISSSNDSRIISLRRLPTATYSDKNVLCITECVIYRFVKEQWIEMDPYYQDRTMSSRIETGVTIFITRLNNNDVSRYQLNGGIVMMEVNFDYDYITYKGLFC